MKKFTAVALATASLLPLAAPAFAQDVVAADEGFSDGEEIVVQARRRDESIQDVPLSVQAVTGAELQKLDIRSFQDITKVVPGLTLSTSGYSTAASLRGIAFNAGASGAGTSVEFYRNDAVIVSNALFTASYDIGQIEVLRGPQGTLRGRASPSGSITITTRRPNLSEVGGYVNGTLAERGKWTFEGAVNVPVIEDKLAIRVAGFVGRNRGNNVYGLNVPLNTIDTDIFAKTRALRASVRADPFDGDLVLDFNYETIFNDIQRYQQVQSLSTWNGGALSPRTINVEDNLGVGAAPERIQNRYKIYNWQAKFRQWGQSLTYVGNHVTGQNLLYSLSDGSGIFASPTAAYPFINAPAGLLTNTYGRRTDSNTRQTVHELRLQNEDRVAGLFDYVVGGMMVNNASPTILMDGTLGSTRTGTLPSGVTSAVGYVPGGFVTPNGTFDSFTLNYMGFGGTYRPRIEKERSLFANLTVHLGESTELSGGIRHIWLKSDSGTVSGISLANPTNSSGYIQRACAGEKQLPDLNAPAFGANFVCGPTKEATIYTASLKHKFTEDLMAYFSFGTSWRPGNSVVGWGLREAAGGTTLEVGPFLAQFLTPPDESSKSFEVGLKTAWFDRRLKFNLSAFYQKFKNLPLYPYSAYALSTPNAGSQSLIGAFNFIAPGNVTVKGVEADMAFDISENFNLGATFAFASTKADNTRVPCTDINNDNIQDQTAPNVNDLINQAGANQVDTCLVNAQAATAPRFSGTVQAEYSHPISDWGNAYLRGFVNWKGATQNDALNPWDDISAYALVDLFAGIRAQNGSWELGLFVKNLFDKRVVTSRAAAPATTPIDVPGLPANAAPYNYLNITTNDPREVGVSLRYAFGSR